ncbi:sensor domain-containing protein [Xylophilus sp.]|uniref:sensor domain-containing protein n=1 Tax=Xylophilus sp. TaxID=2653893 RepID=UPI0013B8797C|nr:GGDEF and EAL domain-containing protein [Xylophilus sp.]KAF1048529.1 MAG: putative signaling protein [Xylophilus sp.]
MRRNEPVTQREYALGEDEALLSATDLQGRIVYANDAFIRVSGFDQDERYGQAHNVVRHPDMPPAAFADMWATIRRGLPWTAIVKNRRKDGDHYWVRANASPLRRGGAVAGYLSVRTRPSAQEVRAHEALYRRINAGARHLVLRRGFAMHGRGLRAVASGQRAGALHAGRGEEFTVLLQPVADAADAERHAAGLLRVLCQPCRVQGFELNFGASLGIALYPADAQDGATLLRYADMAMYEAKARGRASHAFYDEGMGRRMAEKLLLHERLRLALAYGGLALHFQPQVDMVTGRVQEVEALLCWSDPQHGEVSPERFIPVAEATGLILPLGAWVIDAACRQIAQWARAGTPLRVAVNVSVQQLRQADLVEQLRRSLAEHAAPAEPLELEVTESEAMADPGQARAVLRDLQALGVRVALDDFGTGYSSLAHLRQLPVSRIKIDRGFLRPLRRGDPADTDTAMVRAIIGLVRTLGLHVVAEGVESAEQLRFLARHGCDAWQGWLYSPAVPATQVAALLRGAGPDGRPAAM